MVFLWWYTYGRILTYVLYRYCRGTNENRAIRLGIIIREPGIQPWTSPPQKYPKIDNPSVSWPLGYLEDQYTHAKNRFIHPLEGPTILIGLFSPSIPLNFWEFVFLPFSSSLPLCLVVLTFFRGVISSKLLLCLSWRKYEKNTRWSPAPYQTSFLRTKRIPDTHQSGWNQTFGCHNQNEEHRLVWDTFLKLDLLVPWLAKKTNIPQICGLMVMNPMVKSPRKNLKTREVLPWEVSFQYFGQLLGHFHLYLPAFARCG